MWTSLRKTLYRARGYLETDLAGQRFRLDPYHSTFWRKAAAGRWEPETFATLAAHLTPDRDYLDIGAWIGPTVLFEARRARRVEAFEPDPKSAEMLRTNLALNPAEAAKVTVHEKAVWTEAGQRTMGNPNAPGDSMSSLLETGAPHAWTVETVAAASLADLVAPDDKLFIKMDVEGAEYDVLPALAPLFDRPQVAVLIAFHPHVVEKERPRFAHTRRLMQKAFAPFGDFFVERVSRRRIRPSIGAQVARTTGAWVFEAKDNFLFRKNV